MISIKTHLLQAITKIHSIFTHQHKREKIMLLLTILVWIFHAHEDRVKYTRFKLGCCSISVVLRGVSIPDMLFFWNYSIPTNPHPSNKTYHRAPNHPLNRKRRIPDTLSASFPGKRTNSSSFSLANCNLKENCHFKIWTKT